MKEGKAIPEKNEIGATEAAPMINAVLKTSSSVVECTFLEEHSFQKNSKKNFKFFLRRNIECFTYFSEILSTRFKLMPTFAMDILTANRR